jgi:Plasmid encoded RepA protein
MGINSQMRRLFRARISFDRDMEDDDRIGNRWLDMQVAPQGELWWDHKKPLQDDLWESWIELGEDFYKAIVAAPVPVDMRALKALKRSPLALDLYAWATHKTISVLRKGKQQFVPWALLAEQFGCDYSDHLNFKKKAKAALKKIQLVYPGLKLAEATGGVIVLPSSRPAVPYKPRVAQIE